MDHMVELESSIRDANIQNQYLITFFFDLESAHETAWKFEIIKDI